METAIRVNNNLKLLDICQQSSIKNYQTLSKLVIQNETQTTLLKHFFYQHTMFQNISLNNRSFLQFSISNSQITRQAVVQLAELLPKYLMVYDTSKFDFGKVKSPLHLPLKLDSIFKKLRASKVSIQLQDKVKRLLDILEQYEIISPIRRRTTKRKHNHKSRYYSR